MFLWQRKKIFCNSWYKEYIIFQDFSVKFLNIIKNFLYFRNPNHYYLNTFFLMINSTFEFFNFKHTKITTVIYSDICTLYYNYKLESLQ